MGHCAGAGDVAVLLKMQLRPTDSKPATRRVLRALRIEDIARRMYQRWRRQRALAMARQSESSKCRTRLAPFCSGYGIDLGFGGDPIVPHAIRIDFPAPYTSVGKWPVQIGGDASQLNWFRDDVLDFVFSSHLLEDFMDTRGVLIEWLRVLKPGGRLILYCPDEERYRAYCRRTGAFHNPNHKHAHFSLEYVRGLIDQIGRTRTLHQLARAEEYSWDLVVEKERPLNG